MTASPHGRTPSGLLTSRSGERTKLVPSGGTDGTAVCEAGVDREMMRWPGLRIIQYRITPLWVMVRFAKWQTIVNQLARPEDLLYPGGDGTVFAGHGRFPVHRSRATLSAEPPVALSRTPDREEREEGQGAESAVPHHCSSLYRPAQAWNAEVSKPVR